MTWAEDFLRSEDRQRSALAAVCGLLAIAWITVEGMLTNGAGEDSLASVVPFALSAVPGWYLIGRVKRLIRERWSSEIWIWETPGQMVGRWVLRLVLLGIKLFVCVLVGMPATLFCVVLALVPSRRMTSRDAADLEERY